MKKLLPAFLLLLLAALTSCETTVDLPEPPHTPRVALLYTLTTAPQDSSFQQLYEERQLYVSNSQHVFDQRPLSGRADAAVELRDATGAVVERYRARRSRDGQGGSAPGELLGYRPVLGYQPRPGQPYTLRATLPGISEAAESTLTLPAPAAIESATYVARPADPNAGPGDFRGHLSVVLRDDPAAANYYLAYARVLDRQGRPGPWSAVSEDHSRAQDGPAAIDQFRLSSPQYRYDTFPLADAGLNGQRLALSADVRFYSTCFQSPCPAPGYLEVVVSSITAETYEFYLSRRRYFDSDGNPFAEPAPLASNVQGGYGLFGGATDTTYRIRLF